MKKLLLFTAIISLFQVTSQTAQFAWLAGSTFTNQLGTYGTQGVASTTNNPGSRALPVSWTSLDGKLWMFGGSGHATTGSLGNMNDLWNYNPSTSEWVWVTGANIINQVGVYGTKGVPSTTNTPGSRNGGIIWRDNSGNLWMFGGQGYGNAASPGNLNDLWKFNISTNEWVWVTGSSSVNQLGLYGTKGAPSTTNTPGARTESVSWVDNSGNLWLFGGNGKSSTSFDGLLNDLWKYDIATNEWTWISGSNGINTIGANGTIGVTSNLNFPGSRSGAVPFKEGNGDLWLYGGSGFGGTGGLGNLCDLWKYNIATNMWTWISGTNAVNSLAIYGTKGFPVASNRPSGRNWSKGWVDSNDNFWLYGGSGPSSVAGSGTLDDLWQFNKTTNLWVWVNGSNVINPVTIYGTLGVSSSTNTPGGRYHTTGWTDNSGDFWLFAGRTGSPFKSDLWKLTVCNAPEPPSASSTQTICIGSVTTLTASGTSTLGWYSSAVGGIYLGSGNLYTTPSVTANTSFYVQDSSCAFSIRKAVLVTVMQPTITIVGSNTVCTNASTTFTASGAISYTWSTSQTTSTAVVTPSATAVYTVSGTDALGCISSKTKTLTTVVLPNVGIAGSGSVCAGSGITLSASGANTYTWNTGSTATSILAAPASSFVYTVTGKVTSTGCVKTQTALVTVQQVTANISGNYSVCSGGSSILTVSGPNTYTWSSSMIGTVYGSTVTVYPSTSFGYSLMAKDAQGCVKTQVFGITPLANPTVTISSPFQGCPGEAVTITASGASTYTWQPGSIVGSNAVVSPSNTTDYTVTGLNGNNCSNVTVFTQNVSICTSIDEQFATAGLLIYPNPNNGEFTIQSQKADVINVMNELGQTIKIIELNQSNNYSYKMYDLQSGVYILVGKTIKQKIIVTK